MTIKHTRKDIASEPGDIVLDINQNIPRLKNNSQNENYQDDLTISLIKQNQYGEVLLEDLEKAAEEAGEELAPNTVGGQDFIPYNDSSIYLFKVFTDENKTQKLGEGTAQLIGSHNSYKSFKSLTYSLNSGVGQIFYVTENIVTDDSVAYLMYTDEGTTSSNTYASFYPSQQPKINIPLSELVRLKYLENNYYTKTEIDNRIKIYIHVVNSINDLPTQGQSNYIYLVPFTSEDDDTNDANHPNAYKEYVWTDQNKYELVGSTKVNLSGFIRKSELNAELLNASNFTTLSSTVSGHTQALNTLTGHGHGNIDKDGKLNAANKILTSNGDKLIVGVDKINDTQVNVTTTSPNATLYTVLGNINTAISGINTTLSTLSDDYLLKSKIYDEIWGSAGFRNLQTAEANNSPTKTAKLGDYIYSQVYTKNDIDTLIGTILQTQQATLQIL